MRKHKRMWLSPSDPESLSYIAYTLNDWGSDKNMDITIADCNKHISINLWKKGARKKLERLIGVLNEALEAWDAKA